MPTDTPARTIIRVSSLSELIVGCPAKVPHIQAGRERPQHWTAARGTATHAAMAHLMSERMAGNKVPWGALINAYDDAWQLEKPRVDDWSFDDGTVSPDEVQGRGAELLLALAEKTRHIRPVLVEQTWFYDIPGTTYRLQGTPDCPAWDGDDLYLNDWKTALKPWGSYKREHQWQHKGYRLLWKHNAPEHLPAPKGFRWWVGDDETGEVEMIEHTYSNTIEDEVETEVRNAVLLLENDYLPTQKDPYICRFCDWRTEGGC